VTAGGRVLNITGFGRSPEEARESAYAAARMISFPGMQMRGDIAAGIAEEPRAEESTLEGWYEKWIGYKEDENG
jgi:phosphoribosylamine-glycine ligase